MCGICGNVSLSTLSEPEMTRRRVEAMLQAMVHRGPDDIGIFTTESAAIGVTRLAIRGLADENQPMVDADSEVIAVCNGEIDNHRQLRQWLRGHGRLVSRATDVAVIPALYLELGEDFVQRLAGAFAIAIWDPRRPCLILARDRAGERPLFYTEHNNEISFATELAALGSQKRCPWTLNRSALKKYLRFGIFPAPFTPFSEARKLAPGQMIRFDETGAHSRNYWHWHNAATVKETPSLVRLDETFRAAVARQTDVEVDFGVFLSGGIDSSLVSVVARSLHPNRPIKAYTLRFQEASFDESNYAEAVANQLSLDLLTVWVKPEDMRDGIKSLVRLVGEPLADPAWIPAALLSRQAAQDVKMALVGEGADELFGGYPTYIGAEIANRVARLPRWSQRLIRRAVEALPPTDKKVTVSFLLKRFVSAMDLDGLARHLFWISNISPPLLEQLTGEAIAPEPNACAGFCLLDQLQQWDLQNTLAEGLLTKADRSSMSSALELRSPFLDEAVMRFAATLQPEDRIDGFQTKVFLKRYALQYLPKSIVHRRKRGLSVPISAWLRGPLHEWAAEALGRGSLEQVGIRTAAALGLFQEHISGKANHARAIWTLLVLIEWLDWAAEETACGSNARPMRETEKALA
jgi:asparagine synthase (glutamine-hydrolysing)